MRKMSSKLEIESRTRKGKNNITEMRGSKIWNSTESEHLAKVLFEQESEINSMFYDDRLT